MSANNFYTQTVTVEPHGGGQDRYGNKTYTTSVVIKCKFVVKQGMVVNDKGEEYEYDALCYVPLEHDVEMKDKYTFNDTAYKIANIVEQRGTVTTLKHKKLILQRQEV